MLCCRLRGSLFRRRLLDRRLLRRGFFGGRLRGSFFRRGFFGGLFNGLLRRLFFYRFFNGGLLRRRFCNGLFRNRLISCGFLFLSRNGRRLFRGGCGRLCRLPHGSFPAAAALFCRRHGQPDHKRRNGGTPDCDHDDPFYTHTIFLLLRSLGEGKAHPQTVPHRLCAAGGQFCVLSSFYHNVLRFSSLTAK